MIQLKINHMDHKPTAHDQNKGHALLFYQGESKNEWREHNEHPKEY